MAALICRDGKTDGLPDFPQSLVIPGGDRLFNQAHIQFFQLRNDSKGVLDSPALIGVYPQGNGCLLYTSTCNGQKLVARVPSRTGIRADDQVKLALDANKIHVFDSETEEIICH